MGAHTHRVHIMDLRQAPIPLEETFIQLRYQVHTRQGLGRMDRMLEVMTRQFDPQRSTMRPAEKCARPTGIPGQQAEHISLETLLKPMVHCP